MKTQVSIRGKTEQRIVAVISVLQKRPLKSYTYADLSTLTGSHYDACLYICATLCEVGLVERLTQSEGAGGRPKVRFKWVGVDGARVLGTRQRQSSPVKV